MNNALLTVADKTDVEKVPENMLEELIQREQLLSEITKNRVFKRFINLFIDKWINEADYKLKTEKDAKEIYRLQGQISALEKHSTLEKELIFIREQISNIKNPKE